MNLKEELERLFQTSDLSDQDRTGKIPILSAKGVPVETLIDIVQNGGEVKTGIDIVSKKGVLLLEKNARITSAKPLLVIRQNGIFEVPISLKGQGGLWDQNGRQIEMLSEDSEPEKVTEVETEVTTPPPPTVPTLETRIREINEIKKEAADKYKKARQNIRKTIDNVRKSGGIFDMGLVEHTVSELSDFIQKKESSFSFMTKELFLSEDFLFNHSINVCTIGVAILRKFNEHFSESVSRHLENTVTGIRNIKKGGPGSFIYYFPEEIQDMAIGYFLHDIGMTAIPESILNKSEQLTEKEFALVKTHSFEKGIAILKKNNVSNAIIQNIIQYHHAPLYPEEKDGYPLGTPPRGIPAYVKICKIADIYDAMTSKRAYEDALNPIRVVTRLFRTYAQKDPMLQFILHAFVNTVGIYPPSSVVYLTNQQMAYVIDSKGPIVLPFTDDQGRPLRIKSDPIDFGDDTRSGAMLAIDSREPLISPKEAYQSLPSFLKDILFSGSS